MSLRRPSGDPANSKVEVSIILREGTNEQIKTGSAAQTINLGADIFLADGANCYLGRICHHRECHARATCRALHCGQRQHLNDDLQVVTLCPALISAPPIELWPRIVTR